MTIPEDPFMLLSFINMKLRDGDYADMTELCDALGCSTSEIDEKLRSAGFEYQKELNQYR